MKISFLKIINILILIAMVLHVGISMFIHAQNVTNSAPAYVCLFYAIFYLVPLGIINLSVWFVNKIKAK